MKKFINSIALFSLGAFLLLTACGKEQATSPIEDNTAEEVEISLDKEFGGFTTQDESVGFGEASMVSDFADDVEVTDTFSQDVEVTKVLTDETSKVKAYFLRITWGLLEGDSTETDHINFSGSAQVSKGTLVLLRTIRFDGGDAIALPRTDRKSLDFTSNIVTHFDGLALAIIDNDSTDDVGTFTFTAGDYSKTLEFSDLDSLEMIEPVGEGPYEVSIVSRSKDIVPFAGGFLSGHWVKTRRHGGKFRGRWINSLGTNAGHLKGIWGINRNGEKVFKGKYISLNGEFRGLLAGHWNYERGENGGVFRGRWVNRAHDTVGVLRGKFKTGRENDRRGFFHGRYRITKKANAEGDGENGS